MESLRKVKCVCRLCGETKPPSRIKCKINDTNIEQKLIDCCRWHLYEDYKNLPEHICHSCFKSLEASWIFAENVALAQQKLLETFESAIKVETTYVEPEINEPANKEIIDEDVKDIEISCTPIDFGASDDYDYSQNLSDIDNADFDSIEIPEPVPSVSEKKESVTSDNVQFTQPMTPFDFDLLSVLTDDDRNADGTIKLEKIEKLNLEDWSKLYYPCWVCNATHFDNVALKDHISSEHPCNEQRIVCPFCSTKIIFSRRTTLYDHMRKHHLPHLKYCCVKCNVFYWDLDLMKKHVQFHPMPRRTVFSLCEMCGVEFDSASKLRHHYRLHLPVSQIRTFECYMCKVSFKCKKSLVHHMPQHLTYEKIQYECKECLLKFSRPYALRRHSLIHSGGFPHSCEYCGKPFRTKANLKVHVRIHTGERPYGCKLCDYRSIDGPNLRKHVKQRHSSHPTVAVAQSAVPYFPYMNKPEPQPPFTMKIPAHFEQYGQKFDQVKE